MLSSHQLGRAAASATAAALAVALLTSPAWAQQHPAIDSQGNLIAMPFEPDFPVVRSTVERRGETLAFVHISSLSYEEAVAHFEEHYARRTEFAPGWRLIGYVFDIGADCWAFTLRYAAQIYRIEVRPDAVSGGSEITFAGTALTLNYRVTLPTIAPYRAQDVGPIEILP